MKRYAHHQIEQNPDWAEDPVGRGKRGFDERSVPTRDGGQSKWRTQDADQLTNYDGDYEFEEIFHALSSME